jgi:hypothetical protein
MKRSRDQPNKAKIDYLKPVVLDTSMEKLDRNKIKRTQTSGNRKESQGLSIRKMKSHKERELAEEIRLALNNSALSPQYPIQQMLSQSDLEEQEPNKLRRVEDRTFQELVNPYTAKDESQTSILLQKPGKKENGFEFELEQARSRFIKSDSEPESHDQHKMKDSEASESSNHDNLEVEGMDVKTAEYLLAESIQEETYLKNKLKRLRKRIVNLRSRCGTEVGRTPLSRFFSKDSRPKPNGPYNPYMEEKEVASENQETKKMPEVAITKSATATMPEVHIIKLDRDTQMSTSLNKQSNRVQKVEKKDFSVNVKTCFGCSDCSHKEDSFFVPKEKLKTKQMIEADFAPQIRKRESLKGVSRSRNETLTTEGSNQPPRIKVGVRTTNIYPQKIKMKENPTKNPGITQRPNVARKRPITDCTLTDFNPFSDQCLTHIFTDHRPHRLHSNYSKRSFQSPTDPLSISEGEKPNKAKPSKLSSTLNPDRIFRISKR